MGLAYAGTNRQDVLNLLLPVIQSPDVPLEVLAVVSVSCGLIAVSSLDSEVSSVLINKLIDNKDTQTITNNNMRFLLLGLGLLYLGKYLNL